MTDIVLGVPMARTVVRITHAEFSKAGMMAEPLFAVNYERRVEIVVYESALPSEPRVLASATDMRSAEFVGGVWRAERVKKIGIAEAAAHARNLLARRWASIEGPHGDHLYTERPYPVYPMTALDGVPEKYHAD